MTFLLPFPGKILAGKLCPILLTLNKFFRVQYDHGLLSLENIFRGALDFYKTGNEACCANMAAVDIECSPNPNRLCLARTG
jgi:hypothetical protein